MYKYQVVTKINMRHIKMIIISCSSFLQEHYVGKMELPDLGLSEYIRWGKFLSEFINRVHKVRGNFVVAS